METIYSIGVLIAIIGAIYVSVDKALLANIIFTVANIIFIIKALLLFDYHMLILFSVYLIISIFGIINLWKKRNQ